MARTELEQLLEQVTNSIKIADAKSHGENGAFLITDTDLHTAAGGWNAITFMENTVFNAITASNWSGDTITGETFAEGLTIYGDFTAIDLTSGACIAYFATANNTVT
jgi:hypothetical protein